MIRDDAPEREAPAVDAPDLDQLAREQLVRERLAATVDPLTTAQWGVGDAVVALRDLRNDGTYPDADIAVGAILVPAGARGEVLNVGVYLQEHVVYAVAFDNGRIVGCLTRELRDAQPADPQPAGARAADAQGVRR